MKIFLKSMLIIATLFQLSAVNAADLATLLNSVRTMRADFSQTIVDNHGKAIQQSFGTMALQRPGKFRWEVKKPIPQVIIANQTRIWIYDPDLEQVTIRSLNKTAGESPALLLSNDNAQINNDFSVKSMPATAGWNWFSLTPKMADSMFANIQMGFFNNQIREMHLQDHLGHTTQVKFTSAKTNMVLSANLFQFSPPKNVDVIDETKKH
jgi:outer membrane lipoprotein carrier protein